MNQKELKKKLEEYEQLLEEKQEAEHERKQQDEDVVRLKKDLISARTKMNQLMKHNDKLSNRITDLQRRNDDALKDKEVAINSIN